jgi:hypothetical protein
MKPSLEGHYSEDYYYTGDMEQEHAGGAVVQRSHHASHGKRGAMNHEPVAGSPRAVRARLQDQAAQQENHLQIVPANNCPFAISRRCSYVEQRRPAANTAKTNIGAIQDSWEPSSIQPGAFSSVGSGFEMAGHGRSNAQSLQADGHMRSDPLHAPRDHYAAKPAPIPTPVRSMATQTNRESMMRHHRENGGSPYVSDGEGSPRADRENQNAPYSERSGMTGKSAMMDNMSILNTARSVLRDLEYPRKKKFQMSALTQDVVKSISSKPLSTAPDVNLAWGQALTCATNDEFQDLDRNWGCGRGGKNAVEDKVAAVLKKLAKRAEKACMAHLLKADNVDGMAEAPVHEDTDIDVGERCVHMEAQLAAIKQRTAGLKEALQRPSQPREGDQLHVLRNLPAQLEALQSGHEGVEDAAMSAIADTVEQSIQGLVAANAACRQCYQQLLDEHEALQKDNQGFCPPAPINNQAAGVDSGALSILKNLR